MSTVDRPRITFFGAADTVTGSRYLVEYGSSQILLESGLFQGPRELRQRNWDDLIISASGMATGGRVLHHLKRLLPDPLNSVVLVGYQAGGTRGAQLRDGAKQVRIHGEDVTVRAEIHDVGYFSVHADRNDVLGWLRSAPIAPKRIVLIHGENEERHELAPVVEEKTGVKVFTPGYEETLTL